MSETLVNTIDGDKLYAERAVKDASGNSISATYATKSEIPVVDQTYDATSTNAQSGVAVAEALSNVPSSLSAGDGIDITSDVVSAKVDGSTISFNASGELQATVSGGVTDVTVDGSSVVNAQGVAEITMPTFTQVQSDWNQSDNTQVDFIKNKPSLATVATTGAYSDLSGTPSLSAVATSGDYDDLTNKPSIPAAQVQSDWNQSDNTQVDFIKNKPTISNVPSVGSTDDGKALVAHYSGGSGSYSWDNLPSEIFPVEYGVTTYAQITDALTAGKLPVLKYVDSLTSTQYMAVWVGDTVGTSYHFTCTRYSKSTLSEYIGIWDFTISVHGTWSNRVIDTSGFQADWNQTDNHFVNYIKNKPSLATVATTGAYSDLTGTPTIPAAQVQSDWSQSDNTQVDYIKNKPNLATVATTGAYSDLTGTPTIPAAQVQSDWNQSDNTQVDFIKNKPSLATVATTGAYSDLSGTPTIPAAPVQSNWNETDTASLAYIQNKPTIPTMELFEAVYGTTTYADITAAITAKKIVYCKVSPSGATRMAFLAYIGSNSVEFQYYRSLSSRSATNQLDEVSVYTVNASGWTTTTRKAGVLIAAGTGLTSSYANGTVTINGKDTDQTYDATSANPQSGVAVAGALAGKEDAFTVGDGLEMVTSGNTSTLQVEAPVDIVAGPGIVIDNPDGNTMRVSQAYPTDETVLWEQSSYTYGLSSVTLSESYKNFEVIKILNSKGGVDMFYPNNPQGITSVNLNRIAYNFMWMIPWTFTSNTVFSGSTGKIWEVGTNIVTDVPNNAVSSRWIQPVKIIGCKRIASN